MKTTHNDAHYERVKAKVRKNAKVITAGDDTRSVLADLREVVEKSKNTLPPGAGEAKKL